jgi:very-short-patch-repair endonuclease
MEPIPNIVIGQHVEEPKVVRAKQLRREMTAAERMLWNCLRSNRLGGFHFRRQQVIDGFIVDFYCHSAALIVEVDGPGHANQADYDAERDRILGGRGFGIVRFTNEQVFGDVPGVLRRVEALCGDKERT